jgi:choice-of-anchor C domain-containing protein
MLIWGGRELPGETFLNNGARYNYGDDSWGPITQKGAPEPRMLHAAVWTGTEMIVWGGEIASSTQVNTGARYNLGTLEWTPTTQVGAPGRRMFWRPDLGIWTGKEMIVYGGSEYPTSLNSTFVYRPDGTNGPPPPPTNCVATPAGVVAWWRAEENADDVVANHDGIPNDGVSYEPGLVGKAFRVDGAHGRINVPDDESFKLVEALCIEGWVKLANPAYGLVFMRGDDRPGLDPYFLGVNPGVISFGISDNEDSAVVSVPFPTGEWKHVAGTFDAGTGFLKLYLDGVMVAQTHTTRRPARDLDARSNPGLGIGNVSGSSINFPWDGWIDEVALYNRALSDAEIIGLFHAGQRGKCLTTVPPMPRDNLVFNGSFELGLAAPGQLDAPNSTAIAGWTVQSGSIDYYGNAWVAADGERSLDMNGSAPGTLSQQVSGFMVGQTYRLTFLMAGNPYFIPPLPAVKRLRASVGSASQEYSFDATGHSDSNLGWSLRTLDFAASNSTLTLEFTSLTEGAGGPALDNVSITVLINPPPPATNCVTAPAGLAAWWSLDETSLDAVNGISLQLSGGTIYAAGAVRQGLRFAGTNEAVAPATPLLDVGTSEDSRLRRG